MDKLPIELLLLLSTRKSTRKTGWNTHTHTLTCQRTVIVDVIEAAASD